MNMKKIPSQKWKNLLARFSDENQLLMLEESLWRHRMENERQLEYVEI